MTPMQLLARIFFVATVLWIMFTVVLIFHASAGLAKADALFGLVGFGSLLLMVGLLILEKSENRPWPQAGPPSSRGPSA
jgi:hypothetical protein